MGISGLKRRLQKVLLVLAAVAGINSAAQAQVTTYNIWVDGIQVTSQNATTGIGGTGIKSGKVTYDANSSTLLLDNAVIVRGGNACIEIKEEKVKVKFRGVCALSCSSSNVDYPTVYISKSTDFVCEAGSHTTIYRSNSHAVWLYEDKTQLTINGPGQLVVDTWNYLDTDGVTVKSSSSGKSGFVGKNGTQLLVFQDGHNVTVNTRQACLWDFKTVTCSGSGLLYCKATNNSNEPCFVAVAELSLSGSQAIKLPAGATHSSSSIMAGGVKVYAADVAIAGGDIVKVSFANNKGTLNGSGKHFQLKLYGDGYYTSGQSVTVTAVNDGADKDGITFVGWNNANTTSSVLSSSMKYTFSAKDISLYGHYKYYTYTITANASPTDGGSVNVYGSKFWGAEATVEATPAGDAWSFQGWYEGNTRVSTSATYKFAVKSNRNLTAKFYREYLGLKVGNVQVTSDNRDRITGGNIKSGYAVFDPEAKIVSMYNITIEGKERCYNECDLMSHTATHIKFYGNCSLASSNDATIFGRYIPIYLECTEGSNVTLKNTQTDGVAIWFTEQSLYTNSRHNVYILGAGNLTIQSQFYGIRKHPNGKSGTYVTFLQSGNVTITSKIGISRFERLTTSNMTGTLTIKATNNSNNFQVNEIDQFEMANSQEMLPQGAFFNTATKRVEMSGSTPSAITSQDLVITHKTYTISASASPSEGGFISGAGSHKHGASVTLKATPNTGYKFVKWAENSSSGTSVSTSASYTFTANKNRTLVAVFEPIAYTISASANPSSAGTVQGAGSYNYNTQASLSAVPQTGYTFVKWTESGSQVSTNNPYTFTVTKARTLVAVFEAEQYNISVSASPAAGGTVTGGGTKQYGASVTVKATPNSGYKFARWTEGGSQVSTNASYTFTATGNRTLVAVFETEGTPNVPVTGVSLSPTTKALKVGEKFTLAPQITPSNATNQNVTWTSSDATVATVSNGEVTAVGVGSATITVTTADGNKTATCKVTVSAAAATTYALTLVSPTNGTLTASPSGYISEGTEVTLTATPASGYKLKALKAYKTGEASTTVAINGNKFTMPAYEVTVEAEFEKTSSGGGGSTTYFTLSYIASAGGSIKGASVQTVKQGESGTEVEAMASDGHRFVKWSDGLTTAKRTDHNVQGNLTVTAEFEKRDGATGIFDTQLDALSAYPNPTTGMLWVSVPEPVEGTAANVLVYNINGQLLQRVQSQGQVQIDLSGYPSGLYIVRVGNAVAKVVKR